MRWCGGGVVLACVAFVMVALLRLPERNRAALSRGVALGSSGLGLWFCRKFTNLFSLVILGGFDREWAGPD